MSAALETMTSASYRHKAYLRGAGQEETEKYVVQVDKQRVSYLRRNSEYRVPPLIGPKQPTTYCMTQVRMALTIEKSRWRLMRSPVWLNGNKEGNNNTTRNKCIVIQNEQDGATIFALQKWRLPRPVV